MIRTKLGTLLDVSKFLDRAEATFERESGWKHRTVQETLSNFSRLSRRSQFLFGGLLMGKAILPLSRPAPTAAPKARAKKRVGSAKGAPAMEIATAEAPVLHEAAQA